MSIRPSAGRWSWPDTTATGDCWTPTRRSPSPRSPRDTVWLADGHARPRELLGLHSTGNPARPRRHGQSLGRRSRGRGRRAATGCGVLVSLGGDIATPRPGPGGRLADPRDRRPPQRPLRARTDGLDPLGRPRHLEHGGTALEPRRPHDAPHHRPRDRSTGAHDVAHGQRRRGRLHRGEHRLDGGARARPRRAGVACGPGAARAPGRLGRERHDGRRLAAEVSAREGPSP